MKVYIGNKMICLAMPEDNEEVAGYVVIYPDGSETWLTKEIFEFEYREVTEPEFDLMISTVAEELTQDDLAALRDSIPEDIDEIELLSDPIENTMSIDDYVTMEDEDDEDAAIAMAEAEYKVGMEGAVDA